MAGPAPSVAVRKIGNSGVIISLDASFSSETSPSTTTVRGSAAIQPIRRVQVDQGSRAFGFTLNNPCRHLATAGR